MGGVFTRFRNDGKTPHIPVSGRLRCFLSGTHHVDCSVSGGASPRTLPRSCVTAWFFVVDSWPIFAPRTTFDHVHRADFRAEQVAVIFWTRRLAISSSGGREHLRPRVLRFVRFCVCRPSSRGGAVAPISALGAQLRKGRRLCRCVVTYLHTGFKSVRRPERSCISKFLIRVTAFTSSSLRSGCRSTFIRRQRGASTSTHRVLQGIGGRPGSHGG